MRSHVDQRRRVRVSMCAHLSYFQKHVTSSTQAVCHRCWTLSRPLPVTRGATGLLPCCRSGRVVQPAVGSRTIGEQARHRASVAAMTGCVVRGLAGRSAGGRFCLRRERYYIIHRGRPRFPKKAMSFQVAGSTYKRRSIIRFFHLVLQKTSRYRPLGWVTTVASRELIWI